MPQYVRSRAAILLLGALLLPILAACGGGNPSGVVVETIVVEQTVAPETVRETVVVEQTQVVGVEAFTTPHPILSDVRVRQAIAYCTDRTELVNSVYPFLDEGQRQALLMDTFLARDHWAISSDIQTYPFDPEQGKALLEEAGWTVDESSEARVNAAGDPLSIKFTSTDAQFRQTWAAVLEQQLINNCGIQILRSHVPGAFFFGSNSGLQRRDFELAAYAWVGSTDPRGTTLYSCNQIPLPSNNWEGQNYMGWCNEAASQAISAANNTLDRQERIEQFGIVQREFTRDMVSLPLFNRLEAVAAALRLQGLRADPSEYITANIQEWTLNDGSDTVIIGSTQEPASLFQLVESAAATRTIYYLLNATPFTTYSYDYQAGSLTQIPNLENGGATLTEVTVSEGDRVWDINGEPVELAQGVEYRDINGETVTYEGGDITLQQLTVTFEYVDGLTWEDGEPVKQADYELGYRIDCDPESGAVSYNVCNSIQDVAFNSDTSYTVTYLPGVQWPEYSIYTISSYPSHQVLADGRTLADVPAAEWATLGEIAEQPLSNGPYRLVEWVKGQRMVFEPNPNYYAGTPGIPNVTIEFIADTNQAVAQLLTDNVDLLDQSTLGAGPELQSVFEAGDAGQIQVFPINSATWEHLDMNLYIR